MPRSIGQETAPNLAINLPLNLSKIKAKYLQFCLELVIKKKAVNTNFKTCLNMILKEAQLTVLKVNVQFAMQIFCYQ